MKQDSELIKIKSAVKKRLDILKKGQTYSDIIENMVCYFETTGVEPRSGQTPPVVSFIKALQDGNLVLYKRIEDLIKILRNIETNKLDVMLHYFTDTPDVLKPSEELINEQELTQIIDVNDKLSKQLLEKDNMIKNLINQIEELRQIDKSQDIINTVKELLSDKILTKQGNDGFYMSKIHREQLFRKLDTIVNV